jgi:hypothetical protein
MVVHAYCDDWSILQSKYSRAAVKIQADSLIVKLSKYLKRKFNAENRELVAVYALPVVNIRFKIHFFRILPYGNDEYKDIYHLMRHNLFGIIVAVGNE